MFAIAPSVSEPPYSVSESVDVSEESSVGLEGDVGAVLVMDLVSSKTVVGAVRLLVRRFQTNLSHDPCLLSPEELAVDWRVALRADKLC